MSKTIRYRPGEPKPWEPKRRGAGRQQTYDVLGQKVEILVSAKGEVYWRYTRQATWLLAANTVSVLGEDTYFARFLFWAGGVK
jgi:hypothetical protein